MARLLSALGDDLWRFRTKDGFGIETMLDWVIGYCTDEGRTQSGEEIDLRRLAPRRADLEARYGRKLTGPSDGAGVIDFHPGHAIPPPYALDERPQAEPPRSGATDFPANRSAREKVKKWYQVIAGR